MSKSAKERILKSVREGLMSPSEHPFPNMDFEQSIYPPLEDGLDLSFVKHFVHEQGGEFVYCGDPKEFVAHLDQLLNEKKWDKLYCVDPDLQILFDKVKFTRFTSNRAESNIAVMLPEALLARTGSFLLSGNQSEGADFIVDSETVIFVASPQHLTEDLKDGLNIIRKKYNHVPSSITQFTKGEKSDNWSHTDYRFGPDNVYLFLIDN